MSRDPFSEPDIIYKSRIEARRLRKEQGVKLSHAYHVIALSLGYKSWTAMLSDYGLLEGK